MNKGIVYLIQPAQLVGTNRYKIGMSNKIELTRLSAGYLAKNEIFIYYGM